VNDPTRPKSWTDLLASGAHRPFRVIALLIVVVLLSLSDLYMTLLHLLHFGMLEVNPVARRIMEYGSPAALILWKLITVGIAAGILFWARRRATAEWAAAFCCLVLAALTAQWILYNLQVSDSTGDLHAAAKQGVAQWVTMVPQP
jgi:hypothetical protein